jgi:hypothetical protein
MLSNTGIGRHQNASYNYQKESKQMEEDVTMYLYDYRRTIQFMKGAWYHNENQFSILEIFWVFSYTSLPDPRMSEPNTLSSVS